jgi:hypothetical protein
LIFEKRRDKVEHIRWMGGNFEKREERDRTFGCLGCILNKERFVWMMEKWKLSNESRGLCIQRHLPRQATGNHQPFTSIFGSGTNRVLDISISF